MWRSLNHDKTDSKIFLKLFLRLMRGHGERLDMAEILPYAVGLLVLGLAFLDVFFGVSRRRRERIWRSYMRSFNSVGRSKVSDLNNGPFLVSERLPKEGQRVIFLRTCGRWWSGEFMLIDGKPRFGLPGVHLEAVQWIGSIDQVENNEGVG